MTFSMKLIARNPDIWSYINSQQQSAECVVFDGINREHLRIAAILQSERVDSEDVGKQARFIAQAYFSETLPVDHVFLIHQARNAHDTNILNVYRIALNGDDGIAGRVKPVPIEFAINTLDTIVPAAMIADLFVQSVFGQLTSHQNYVQIW